MWIWRRIFMGQSSCCIHLQSITKEKNNEGAYSIKDKDNNLLQQEIGERWKEYFDELLNVESNSELTAEAELDVGRAMNEEPILITLEEIKHAIAAMKKGKSPGADGLPVEILKAGDECV